MADFDPDAYLAQKRGGGGGGFDPDRYLAEKRGHARAPAAPPAQDNQGLAGIARDFTQHPLESAGLYLNPATQLPMVAQRFLAPDSADQMVDFTRAGRHAMTLGLDEKAAGALGAVSGQGFAPAQAEQRASNAESFDRSPGAALAGTAVGAFGAPVPGLGPLKGVKGVAGVAGRVAAGGAVGAGIGATSAWAGDRPIGPAALLGGAVGAGGATLAEGANALADRAGSLFGRMRSAIAGGMPAQRVEAVAPEAGEVVEGQVIGRGARPPAPAPPAPPAGRPMGPRGLTWAEQPPQAAPPPAAGRPMGAPGQTQVEDTLVRGFRTEPDAMEGVADTLPSPPRPGGTSNMRSPGFQPRPAPPPEPDTPEVIAAAARARREAAGVGMGPAPAPRQAPGAPMAPPASGREVPMVRVLGKDPQAAADAEIGAAGGQFASAAKRGAMQGGLSGGMVGAAMGNPLAGAAAGAKLGAARSIGALAARNPAARAYLVQRAQQLLRTDPEKAQRLFQALEIDRSSGP